jgi:hypothetical protein
LITIVGVASTAPVNCAVPCAISVNPTAVRKSTRPTPGHRPGNAEKSLCTLLEG